MIPKVIIICGSLVCLEVTMVIVCMILSSSLAVGNFCQVIIFAGENFICDDIQTNKHTKLHISDLIV